VGVNVGNGNSVTAMFIFNVQKLGMLPIDCQPCGSEEEICWANYPVYNFRSNPTYITWDRGTDRQHLRINAHAVIAFCTSLTGLGHAVTHAALGWPDITH